MKNVLFVAFSHGQLSQIQVDDFVATFGETQVIYLTDLGPEAETLQRQLKNVDPKATKEIVHGLAMQVVRWANTSKATHTLIQSAPGLNEFAAATAADMGMTPVVVCTARNVVETQLPNGKVEKKSIFSHGAWREIF